MEYNNLASYGMASFEKEPISHCCGAEATHRNGYGVYGLLICDDCEEECFNIHDDDDERAEQLLAHIEICFDDLEEGQTSVDYFLELVEDKDHPYLDDLNPQHPFNSYDDFFGK